MIKAALKREMERLDGPDDIKTLLAMVPGSTPEMVSDIVHSWTERNEPPKPPIILTRPTRSAPPKLTRPT